MYDAGTAALSVVPDFGRVQKAIRKEVAGWGITAGQAFGPAFKRTVKAATKDTEVGPSAASARRQGAVAGKAYGEGFKAGSKAVGEDTPVGPSKTSSRKRGADAGGSFADGFRQRVNAALRNLPPIEIGAATTEADQKLRDLRAALQRLLDQRIGVDVDAASALAELRRIQSELDDLGQSSADVQVRADTAAASAQLAAVAAQAERLDRQHVGIDVDVDAGSAVAGLAATGFAASRAGGHVSGLGVAGASLAPLIVPAAAAVVAAVAAIGPAAVGAGAALGVGLLGVMGISDAVKALGAAQDDAGKSAAALAQRQSTVASAADGVRSAERALANTRASNADGARRAARQVADAERGVARAQQEARQATLDLIRAREDERRANQDLAFNLEGTQLAQRRATLDLADAKTDLDKVLANPKATDAQREAARIAYAEIELRVRELAVQQKRLSADQQKATRVGVDGSDRVRAAQERVRDTTVGVADAQRSLAEAVRGQQTQQRQAAFAIANAQQSLAGAQRSLAQATVQAGVAGSAAMATLGASMAALSPAGRRFARFIFGLKDEFRGLRDAAAEGFLPGLQSGIERLLPRLPKVERFIGGIARVMGDLADRAGAALTGPAWSKFFSFVDRVAGPALEQMAVGTGNLILGFSNLLAAFEPLSKEMGDGLLGLTERFVAWSASLDQNQGFQNFLGYVAEFGPMFLSFLGKVTKLFFRLGVALAPLGAAMLVGLTLLTDWLNSLDPGVLLGIVAGVAGIVAGFVAFAFGPLTAVAAIAAAIIALVGTILYAYNNVSWFKTAVDAVFQAIAVTALWLWRSILVPAFNGIVIAARAVGAAAMWLWRNAIKPAFDGIAAVVTWLWRNVWQPTFKAIGFWVKNIIGPVVTGLWRNVFVPAFKGIQLAVSIAWAVIKVIFGVIKIAVKVLGAVFVLLWRNVVAPIWRRIGEVISSAWHNVIRPIFAKFGNFVKDHVAPAFRKGVSAIEAAWNRVRSVAKVPIRFVVETVINKALIGTFNRIATKFGVDKIDPVPLPAGFAAGGVLPGYTPGRDVHLFQSPTAGALALSGGEGIIRPEGTRALGAEWVDGINRASRSGGVSGAQRWLGGYADGGILGRLARAASRAKKTAGDAITGVKDLFSDPAGVLRKLVEKVLGLTPGGASTFRSAAMGLPKALLGPITDRLKNLFSGPDGLPGGPGGPGNSLGGSAGMMRVLRSAFPGLRLISGYRPGSTTLSGNRSYHASDRAVDVPPDRAVAAWIHRMWGRSTRELITPYPQYNLWSGRPHRYTGAVWNQHNFAGGNAHVHWAYDQGGWLPPGMTQVVNNTGSPEAVLTSQQWSQISRLSSHAEPGARREYNFQFANTNLTSARLRALQDREDALALAGRPT